MPNEPLNIWCSTRFGSEALHRLQSGIGPHRLLMAASLHTSNLVPGAADPQLEQADVAFGQPDPAVVVRSQRLRWVHLTTAGYERYDREDVKAAMKARQAPLTNSSWVYAEPCAQHVLAMMLALSRQMPLSWSNQEGPRLWPIMETRSRCYLLSGQSALLVGFGAIGQRLAELLAPFHMNVRAVRRRVRGDESVPTHPLADLDRLLGEADHVIDLLPGGAGTEQLISAARIARMKSTAVFYNIGRGSTVDQEALAHALQSGRLAAAYLDVTSPEPLPPEHPLWRLANCHITTHTAGGHHNEQLRLVEHFLENLSRWLRGQALRDRIV